MSDNKQKTDEINWAEFQKKYFDALMSFNSSPSFTSNNNSQENAFWNNAMEHWWKSMKMKSGSSFENENLFEKVIEQSRNYYFMAEQFSSLVEGISKFKNKKKDVTDFINNKFEELQAMFAQAPENLNWSSFIDAYELPFETMKNNAASSMFDFSSLFDGMNPDVKKIRNQLLSMPGLGHNRETQEKLQKLIKLGAIYQDYNNENQVVMTRLSQDALELMRKKILRMSKKGEDFNSIRQVYDLWIESNEKVYGDYASSEEYSELNGKLVNSQMAFMKLSHEVNEDILSAMNLPTTRAMKELERRHYELRKKVKALESELKSVKENMSKKTTVVTKPVVVKKKSVSASSNVTKKKVAKKKVAKKKSVSKAAKPEKKKAVNKAARRPAKKKAKKRSRSRSAAVKKDVIEIKF